MSKLLKQTLGGLESTHALCVLLVLIRIKKPYNVTSVTAGLMPLAMVFLSLNMNHLSKRMKAFHGIAYLADTELG